jgi:Tfp pilus assembly protein PilN
MSPEIPPYDEAPEAPEADQAAAVSAAPEPFPPPRPAAAPGTAGSAGSASSAAKPLARVEPLNLAGRPFLNSRPVVRVSLLLLAFGMVLLIGNVSRFLNYREASADKRAQIARGDAEIQKAQAAQSQLQKKLDSFNLEEQNRKVDFLNRQIENRTFSWSTLLDRIAERLPNGVRLNRLAPLTGEKAERELQRSRSSSRRGRTADQVTLAITGEDRDDEALMTFVDAFYKPPFSYPDLVREEPAENRAENGKPEDSKLKKFELTVQYHPSASGAKLPPAGAGGTGAVPRLEELPAPAPTPKTTLRATPAPPSGPGVPRKGGRP